MRWLARVAEQKCFAADAAWVEDAAGKKVQLPDANGVLADLDCQWQMATPGASIIKIFVGA